MKKKTALLLVGALILGSCFSSFKINGNIYKTQTSVYADESSVDINKLLDMNELYGWAATPGEGIKTTTGGGRATPVVVSTFEEFQNVAAGNAPKVIVIDGVIDTRDSFVSVGSNKTIVGKDDSAEIHGGIHIYDASNVIVSNLNFNGGWPQVGPDDCIDVANSHHVWLNHLNLYNSFDGNLDIKMGSDYITVSWCKFSYTDDAVDGITPDHTHRLSCLVGSGGGDHDDTDMDKLRVSYHHNWFADNLNQRMPRVMYGRVHVFNNYYTCEFNDYCIGVDSYGSVLIEDNYFQNVNNPHKFMYPDLDLPAVITARGNEYDNSEGYKHVGQKQFDSNVKEFDSAVYDYWLNDVKDIPEVVSSYAGPKNDISDKSQFSDKISNTTLIKGKDDSSYVPPEDLEPLPTLKPVNTDNDNPVIYDKESDTYTYNGYNSLGYSSYYTIENPFRGKSFWDYDFEMGNEYGPGVTIAYWVNVPENAIDSTVLNFNLENDRQIERKDAVKYNSCKEYIEGDYRYAMGESDTYVDSEGNEYQVLSGDIGYLVQYSPLYPKEGCYKLVPEGGSIFVHKKGLDSNDESNWVYIDYIGEGYYDEYGKLFDEEGGENSKIKEAYISGSFSIYASGTIGFRQDNGEALQINPYLQSYGNKIDIQTTNQFYYWGNGGFQSQKGSTFITPTMSGKGKWHFVAVVVQDDWVQFYMDGKEISDFYLTAWGAALKDKEGVAGSSFNHGWGYRLRMQYPTDIAQTAMTLLEFISDEDTVLTVGGRGAASEVLGQDIIGTVSGTKVKELKFYDRVVPSYCIKKDGIDLDASPQTPTPPPTNKPTEKPSPTPNVLLGDVDNDGEVSLKDATTVLKLALAIIETSSENEFLAADVNKDKEIDLTDANIVLKMALGIKLEE